MSLFVRTKDIEFVYYFILEKNIKILIFLTKNLSVK